MNVEEGSPRPIWPGASLYALPSTIDCRLAGRPFFQAGRLAGAVVVADGAFAGAGDAGHPGGAGVAAEAAVRFVVDDVDTGAVAVVHAGGAAGNALAGGVVEELVVGAGDRDALTIAEC